MKAKLANNEPVLVVSLHLTDPAVFEMTSLFGFDAIWIDLEHHGTSVETAAQLMRAARVGSADILARPAKGEWMRMARLLEAGAQGILYPRCESADEAAELVRWSRFAPAGERGIDGAGPDAPYLFVPLEQYVRQANDQTLLAVQLESPSAIERADEIAAVPGLDVLFFGPGDFSVLSGFAGQWDHPAVQGAVERVAHVARHHGVHWGMPAFSPDHARRLLDQGARFIAFGNDLVTLKMGWESLQRDFEELGFSFLRHPDRS